MTDQIRQEFQFDAAQAVETIRQLNAGLAELNQNLGRTAGAANQFNKAGVRIPSTYNQIGTAGVRATSSIRNEWEKLISVQGRYTTSLALASRIVYTQAIVSGFRQVRRSIEETIQASADFQKQLAEIRSIDTEGIFGPELGDRLRSISREFNIALPDVGEGAYEALSAQVLKTSEDMRFLDAAAAFSKGSLTSMEASVAGLAGALNAYGQTTENVDRLASQFNETINLGTLRGEELAHQFGTVATLGKTLGVSQGELLASVAALTNAGVPQAQAFTQIRGALTGLVKPTETLTKVMRENGIASAEQLIQSRGWGGALRFLRDQTDGTVQGTADLFQNQRALLGVLSLGGTNAEFFGEALERIEGVSSRLNKERAQQVMANDAEQLSKKFNQLKVDMIPVGDGLITIANKSFQAGKAMTDTLGVGLAKVITQFTDYQLEADKVAAANQNLADLFGIDLTLGSAVDPFTGERAKIISETEVRQRQLETFNRRREDANRALEQAEALHAERINKINFQSADQARQWTEQHISDTQRRIAATQKQISDTQQLLQSAAPDIRARQERRDFDTQTGGLSDAQRAMALTQRAADLAARAAADMQRAGQTGDRELAQRARAQFESAQATGEEARALSESAGDRRGALHAARQLQGLSSQQESAEKSMSAALKNRLPTLQEQLERQQSSLTSAQALVTELKKADPKPFQDIERAMQGAASAAGNITLPGPGGPGQTAYHAAGGLARGTDTIPAMLSPGEFVVNARASRAFYSQLQAMNAGRAPVYRQDGGPVTNVNVGDIQVHGAGEPSIAASEVLRQIQRLARRGLA